MQDFGANQIKPCTKTYTKLSTNPTPIKTFVFRETVFFELSNRELKHVSEKLREDMKDEFGTGKKTNVIVKKAKTDNVGNWLTPADFATYTAKHNELVLVVVTLLKHCSEDTILNEINWIL